VGRRLDAVVGAVRTTMPAFSGAWSDLLGAGWEKAWPCGCRLSNLIPGGKIVQPLVWHYRKGVNCQGEDIHRTLLQQRLAVC